MDTAYTENHHPMAVSMTMPVATKPSDSKMAGEKKRGNLDEMMEKISERRQKRMMENCEAAASREQENRLIPVNWSLKCFKFEGGK